MNNICRLWLILFCLSPGRRSLYGQQAPPPLGQLVDAGGHSLHMQIMGHGTPAVILESGSGDFSFVWWLVQPEVAKTTCVVSYDRAGFAWSDPGPVPRTDHQIALELHTALHNARVGPPYILVGQSFGGNLVRAFARYYRKEVAGMVLVDALNENARIIIGNKPMRIREFAKGRIAPPPVAVYSSRRQEEDTPVRAYNLISFPMTLLPDSVQKLQIWAQNKPVFRAAVDSEMTWSPEDVERTYENRGRPEYMLGNIPLIVLTRGKGGYRGRPDSAELETERLAQQKELARLSTNSIQIVDQHSGHNIHLEDPQLVIYAIREVVEAARRQEPIGILHGRNARSD